MSSSGVAFSIAEDVPEERYPEILAAMRAVPGVRSVAMLLPESTAAAVRRMGVVDPESGGDVQELAARLEEIPGLEYAAPTAERGM